MKKRTQIEAELAQLALEIGGKSHSEAAKAVLDLYKGLALLEAEETIEQQLAAAQQDMQSQLRAKTAELQSEVSGNALQRTVSVWRRTCRKVVQEILLSFILPRKVSRSVGPSLSTAKMPTIAV